MDTLKRDFEQLLPDTAIEIKIDERARPGVAIVRAERARAYMETAINLSRDTDEMYIAMVALTIKNTIRKILEDHQL